MIHRNAVRAVVLAALLSVPAGAQANPMDSIRKLPGYRESYDTATLITAAKLNRLPAAQRREWQAYLDRSRALHAADTASMNRELRSVGRTAMVRAPYAHDFSLKPYMNTRWFRTDSAAHMTDIILSFQAPNGGWSKHVDFTQHVRAPGESYFGEDTAWMWISTIDNQATTEEIRFLRRTEMGPRANDRSVGAVNRGIQYLLASQYPNGCFPQVYPLEGSYHDAATFNDDATVNVLRLFQEIGQSDVADNTAQVQISRAFVRGIECILDAQARANGRLTAWGQQHDPITLVPTSARSYELPSLASLESAGIVDLLMTIWHPDVRVVQSVYAATDWLRSVELHGIRYENYKLTSDANAPPLWARMYEIGTNRPIMANRDGIKLYDWNKLTDRRTGYGWYTTKPAETLAAFDVWAKSHPRPK